MSNQQTLEQLLHERISLFTASDKPKEIIDEHVEKMFKSVIDSAFRTYGDMGRAVEEAIKAAMPGNVSEMVELARYNSLIVNAMKEKWAEAGVGDDMIRRTHAAIDEVMKGMEVPEFVSLRQLLEAFVENHAEEAMENGWEAPVISFEESETFRSEYMHISFSKDPGDERYSRHSRDNRLHVRFEGKNEEGHHIAEAFSAEIEGRVMGRAMGVWSSEWERLLVALYYGGAKLVIDCDEDDFSYPCHD